MNKVEVGRFYRISPMSVRTGLTYFKQYGEARRFLIFTLRVGGTYSDWLWFAVNGGRYRFIPYSRTEWKWSMQYWKLLPAKRVPKKVLNDLVLLRCDILPKDADVPENPR